MRKAIHKAVYPETGYENKIEELTLHLIEQEKDNRELRERVARLERQTGLPQEAAPER